MSEISSKGKVWMESEVWRARKKWSRYRRKRKQTLYRGTVKNKSGAHASDQGCSGNMP